MPAGFGKPKPKAAAVSGGLTSLGFYSAGGGIPEGDYAFKFDVVMHQATDQNGNARGPERLGVMVTAYPLADAEAKPIEKFLAFGRKAHLSWQPDPETGKDVVKIEGGAGAPLPASSNWSYFFKSMIDSGAPEGLPDLGSYDGMWAHLANIPEPEDRKGFVSDATGEAADEQAIKGPTTIPVITEIKEDGKPWEGTGGLPEQPKKVAKPAFGKAAAKPAAKAKPAPAPEPEEEEAPVEGELDEAVKDAALTALTKVIGAVPKGSKLTKVKARTEVFKAIKDKTMASAVLEAVFDNETILEQALSELSHVINGAFIVPE